MIDNIQNGVFVTKYVVFIRDSQTGFWRVAKRFIPNYQKSTGIGLKRRFFFFSQPVPEKRITNESEARTKARIDAVKEAVLLRADGHDVKVVGYDEETWLGETIESAWVIWLNGEWMDG